MPALQVTVNDTFNRGQTVDYDLRDLLNAAGVNDSNIEAVTSVAINARILSDSNSVGKHGSWWFSPQSRNNQIGGTWTSSNGTVPISNIGSTAILGMNTVPPNPGQQVADGTVTATYYPLDGEQPIDGYQADGTYLRVSLELIDGTTGAIYNTGSVSGQITTLTIFYSTVVDGVAPTSCGVFGVGSFGSAVFGQTCAVVNAAFTVSPGPTGIIPASFTFDASDTVVTPGGELLTYSWDWGDGSTGAGVNPTKVYTQPGLYRVTLAVFAESGSYDSTSVILAVDDGVSSIPPPRNLGNNVLGSCSTDKYSVEITTRGGYARLADLSEWVETIDWNRVMDDRSTAEVVIRKRAGCHEPLSWVDPFATELRIWRDDEMVWEGPVMEYDEQQSIAVITASDVTAWLGYRRVTETIDFETLPGVAPTEIARLVLEQAFRDDDPRVLEYMDIRSGGDLITRKIDTEDRQPLAEQELRNLAGSFIDYTVVGRRIIVWPDNYYLSNIGTLMHRHLAGDGWSILTRGQDYGSRFVMEGDAVQGIVGGVNERYGLVEQLLRDDTILDTATATTAAQKVYDTRAARPPRWLVFSDGTQIASDAPVTIRQLVPGVRLVADIDGEDIAQPFRQNMRVTRVSVGVDQDGEQVRIGAFAVGFDGFPLGTVGDEATTSLPQPPVASFTASITTGEAPLTVNVDGNGSYDPDGSISNYRWVWGDGTPDSSGPTASHEYLTPGNYAIVLTVTDNEGMIDSTVVNVVVEVPGGNLAPSASFSYVEAGPLEFDFDASGSNDPDGSIASYVWNFGDGNSDTGAQVTHTYAAGGSYFVTLTVTDNGGATGEQTQQVPVGVANVAPTAAFTTTTAATSDTTEVDATTSNDTDGTIVDYLWDWGDGSTTNTAVPVTTHQYSENGAYTITLTVTDDDGATDTTTGTVNITGYGLPAMIADQSGGLTVNFDASGSTATGQTITAWEWEFGDGATGTGETTSHTYGAAGDQTVRLRVTTSTGTVSPWREFFISPKVGGADPISMVVLGDSIANLHTPTFNAGGDQFTTRSRWQDMIAATVAAKHGTVVARKHWSQTGGNTVADTDPRVAGAFYDSGPASPATPGVLIHWDASAPGYLSEMYDTNGINSLGDTNNSNFTVGHPPATNIKYVFVCLGFNDIHGPQCGGLPPRAYSTIVNNLTQLVQPYKSIADYIVFVNEWDINEAHPTWTSGFWTNFACGGNAYHTAGDMVAANFAPLGVASNLSSDPAATATVLLCDTPDDPLTDESNDAVHPIQGGHNTYRDGIVAVLETDGFLP